MYKNAHSQTLPFGKRVLVLAPHPDDESIGCGGTLHQHSLNGDFVQVVFLTSGNAAKQIPPVKNFKDYSLLRKEEARQACRTLGLINSPLFLDFPDGQLSGYEEELKKKLSELILKFQPEILYSPGLYDPHPDHITTSRLAWFLAQEFKYIENIYFYEVENPLPCPHINIDISKSFAIKLNAIEHYKSQLVIYDYKKSILSLNQFRALKHDPKIEAVESFLCAEKGNFSQSIETFFQLHSPSFNHAQKISIEKPFFSIILRTKNRPYFLREALLSCASQTYKRFEVLLINDGGPDIDKIALEFQNKIQLKVIQLDKSLGRSAVLNIAIDRSRGDFINLLDDDDLFLPHHLKTMASAIGNSYSHVLYSNTQYSSIYWVKDQYIKSPTRVDPIFQFSKNTLLFTNPLKTNAVVFSREIYNKTGPFDPHLTYHEDWDYWIRLSEICDFRHVDHLTAEIRLVDQKNYNPYISLIMEKHWKKHHALSTSQFLENFYLPQYKNLERKVIELEEKISLLKAENKSLHRQIQSIAQSISWKITQPARFILSKKIKNKIFPFLNSPSKD